MVILRQIFKKQSGSVLIRFTLYKMGWSAGSLWSR